MLALVTGASGFIGKHLVAALIDAGWDVVGLRRNRADEDNSPPYPMLSGDVTDKAFLREVLHNRPFDAVFHLAALNASATASDLYRVNVVGTATLLDAVCALGRPEIRVVLMGSSAQYGEAGEAPIDEDTPSNPINYYGSSKACGDVMGWLAFRQTGGHILRARAFNVIGPGQGPDRIQGAVVEQVVEIEAGRRRPLVEVGDVSAHRDFIDVRDVAAGLIAIAERGEPGAVYNLCSGRARQVRTVVDGLIELAKVPIQIAHRAVCRSASDAAYQRGSYDKLRRTANWEPVVAFGASLADALAERRQQVASARARDGLNLSTGSSTR